MIEVRQLNRRFGSVHALKDVSFDVAAGDVVGLLGPNGAGKTTLLRILTGFLPAGSGEVRIAGLDVFRDCRQVRERIGYLPENVPLYPEMRVNEYLRFRARIKGLHGKVRRTRVGEAKELCGLGPVGRKLIGRLSRGYRQRVGLADALLAKPPLLILDEPTIGLDPHQVRQMRSLIASLADRHTVLLSTHILSEVELSCRRVLIIDQGRIVADDTPRELHDRWAGATRIHAQIRGPHEAVIARLSRLDGLRDCQVELHGEWVHADLQTGLDRDVRPSVFELCARNGWTLRELRRQRGSLEDTFVGMTGSGEDTRG